MQINAIKFHLNGQVWVKEHLEDSWVPFDGYIVNNAFGDHQRAVVEIIGALSRDGLKIRGGQVLEGE